jgi:hypothetical protein
MKSPLKKSNVQKPAGDGKPKMEDMKNPLDDTKVIYDKDKTNVYLSFDD